MELAQLVIGGSAPTRTIPRENSSIKIYQAPEVRDTLVTSLQPSTDIYRYEDVEVEYFVCHIVLFES